MSGPEKDDGEAQDREFNRMLAVDRFRQERWDTQVSAHYRQSWDSQKVAFRFAEIGLQSAFLVNGGALVAIPPLMEWISSRGRSEVPFDAAAFVIGLVLAAASALVAYLNFLSLAGYYVEVAEKRAIELQAEFFGNALTPDDPKLVEHTKILQRTQCKVTASQIGAVALCVLSYAAFIAGAYDFIELGRANGGFSAEIPKHDALGERKR
jgi:hypothetical protein